VAVTTLRTAARLLHRSPATLRRWVRLGAPTVRPGEAGRGNGSLVEVTALSEWRVQRAGAVLPADRAAAYLALQIASSGIWRAFTKPPEGSAVQLWKALGLPRDEVGALLLQVFEEIARQATGHPVADDELPAEIRRLCTVLAESRRR